VARWLNKALNFGKARMRVVGSQTWHGSLIMEGSLALPGSHNPVGSQKSVGSLWHVGSQQIQRLSLQFGSQSINGSRDS